MPERVLTLGTIPLHTLRITKKLGKLKILKDVSVSKKVVQSILDAFEILIER